MGITQNYLHNKMTSSRKSKVPFEHTIASFRGSMFEAKTKPQTLKELLTHTPIPKPDL